MPFDINTNANTRYFALEFILRLKEKGTPIETPLKSIIVTKIIEACTEFGEPWANSKAKEGFFNSLVDKVIEKDWDASDLEAATTELGLESVAASHPLTTDSEANAALEDIVDKLSFSHPGHGESKSSVEDGHFSIPPGGETDVEDITFDLGAMLPFLSSFVVDHHEELLGFLRLGLFKGFHRESVMDAAFKSLSFQAIFVIATLTALRGPVKVATDKDIGQIPVTTNTGSRKTINALYNEKVLSQEKSRAKELGRRSLTAGRICSAFADLAAYGMLLLSQNGLITKRVEDNALPAWMQFTQAASLPMSRDWRMAHIDFCKKFSAIIKGTFSATIYAQQSSNCFLPDGRVKSVLVEYSHGKILDDISENAPYEADKDTGSSESKSAT